MKDREKTKKQLLNELVELRHQIAELEISEEQCKKTEDLLSITEAKGKQAEEALQESEKRYRKQFEEAIDAIFLADLGTGMIVDCNIAASKLLEREKSEIIGKHQSFLHPAEDIKNGFSKTFKSHMTGESSELLEDRVITKLGQIKDVAIRASKITIEGKKVMQGIFRDITERKRVEEELREAREELETRVRERTAELVTITEKLKQEIGERKRIERALNEVNLRFLTLINAIPDIVFFKDVQGRHLIVNKATEEFHGLSQKDIIEKTCESFLPLDLAEQCKKSDNEVFEMRKPFRSEEQAIGKNGNIIFLDTFKIPLYDESDNPIGLVGISRDITAHKKAEEALKQREQELEIKTHNLEEANIALKVLLKRREEDKTELEEKILLNMKELVIPYLEKLKKNRLDERQEAYLNILESNLKDIVSPFSHKLSSKFLNFTPTEIRIANLLWQGKTSKEIAELINSSPKAVAFHRENIRKKLGLRNKKINLKSYLLSLP